MKIIKVGCKEITLPSYMMSLQDITQTNPDCIIACGVHPSGVLLIVTGDIDTKEIIPNGRRHPITAKPIGHGEYIEIKFQGDDLPRILASRPVIRSARSCLLGGELYIWDTYVGNFEIS